MRMADIIIKKRDGKSLSDEDIAFFIDGYVKGEIPDYQASALLMAIYFRGMDTRELSTFTHKMMYSGDIIDLSDIPRVKVDKHSTGGVGDKVSLILAPLAAAAGVPVPMVAGRALGHTGGTLDKLESIPGFNVNLTIAEFKEQLRNIGAAIMGQTTNFVPADKRLYALRDVTATIESIPLISASIMSKKLAEGADDLVIDVKTGNGAFMYSLEKAIDLAEHLVSIGNEMGRKVITIITDMNQPLGNNIGNSLEVIEAIKCLKGERSVECDLMKITLTLGSYMLVLGKICNTLDDAHKILTHLLQSGKALDKFAELITAQGGNARVIDNFNLLPLALNKYRIDSPASGYITKFATKNIGIASMLLGAGRRMYQDTIDHGVGIIAKKKIGDAVGKGEPIFEIYYNNQNKLNESLEILNKSFTIEENPITPPQLIYKILGNVSIQCSA